MRNGDTEDYTYDEYLNISTCYYYINSDQSKHNIKIQEISLYKGRYSRLYITEKKMYIPNTII
jgi:hypothetical protein